MNYQHILLAVGALFALAGAGVATAAPARPDSPAAPANDRLVTVVLVGDVLEIAGDGAANAVTLTSVDADSVTVSEGGPPVQYDGVSHVIINLDGGGDSLMVANEPSAFFEGNITYNGGDGFDTLTYAEAAEAGAFSVAYNLGPGPDEGSVLVSESGREQLLVFDGLEPVVDLVVAASLTVDGTNAANEITYTEGTVAGRGLVSVDNFETIEFANKTSLIINGLNGDDVITLANPNVPTGLTDILVDGGGASAGDRLVSTGVPGVFDPQIVQPIGLGAGVVTNLIGLQPPYIFFGIENLHVIGQLVDDDTIAINGTLGNDEFEYRPGLTASEGTVSGLMDQAGAAYPLVNITFEGMNQSTGLVFNFLGTVGGSDRFIYNGLETGESIGLSTSSEGGVSLEARDSSTVLVADLSLENMTRLSVNAHGGDDFIGFGPSPVIDVDTVIDGGAGDDSLIAQLEGADTLVRFGDLPGSLAISTAVESLDTRGLEFVSVDSLGALVEVSGTTNDDEITVSKRGSLAGGPALEVSIAGKLPLVEVARARALQIDGGVAGDDTLTVRGDALDDVIEVSDTSLLLNDLDVRFDSNIEQLLVEGLAGDDLISILLTPDIPLRVYGGEGADELTGSDEDDYLDGGPGPDHFDGNRGDDLVFGSDGNDELVWNTRDGDDYFDGGSGSDLVTVNGRGGPDHIEVSGEGALVRVARTNVAPFELYLSAEKLQVKGRGGADQIGGDAGLLGLVSLEIYGGGGADEIDGGDGNDLLKGGGGNDLIRGREGGDRIYGDAGEDDLFGNDGADRLHANDDEEDRVTGGSGWDWARLDLELDDFNAVEEFVDG
jgi:hypothetical protein